jgi:hypothetical protein
METKFNLVKRTFSDVFGQSYSPKEYKGPQYTQTITTNENYVYVHDCVFSYCSSSSNGGALNCGSSVYKLLVEQTTFISCSTSSSSGGGIYFYSTTNGECVLNKICAFNCSSTGNGQFTYIYTKNDVSYKNYVNDTSTTYSVKKSGSAQTALAHYYGIILCPSVNISHHECYRYPALISCPTLSSISDTSIISYCSIVNNTANGGHGCISLETSSSTHCVESCNIIKNKQTVYSSYEITLWTNTNILIKDSCILGNNEGYGVFYASGSSAKITLSNCTIDDDIISKTRYSGSVTFTKTIERSFIHALSHISTQKCDSYFDSYGTLTANPDIPPQNTKDRCFGCFTPHNIKKAMIDPFRSIEFIFLLTILPSNPSNDYYFDPNCIFRLGI